VAQWGPEHGGTLASDLHQVPEEQLCAVIALRLGLTRRGVRVDRLVSRGEFGTLFYGHMRHPTPRDVAIKVTYMASEDNRRLPVTSRATNVADFLREVSVAEYVHRNVPSMRQRMVQTYDSYIVEMEPGLHMGVQIMDWLSGCTLAQFVRDHASDEARLRAVLDLALQLIADLHRHHVYHNDLHFGNLWVRQVGGQDRVLLLDWGLAFLYPGAPFQVADADLLRFHQAAETYPGVTSLLPRGPDMSDVQASEPFRYMQDTMRAFMQEVGFRSAFPVDDVEAEVGKMTMAVSRMNHNRTRLAVPPMQRARATRRRGPSVWEDDSLSERHADDSHRDTSPPRRTLHLDRGPVRAQAPLSFGSGAATPPPSPPPSPPPRSPPQGRSLEEPDAADRTRARLDF
jgi:serine/threonine protein kinase